MENNKETSFENRSGVAKKIVWIVPELEGGIQTYSQMLFSEVSLQSEKAGYEVLGHVSVATRDLFVLPAKLEELQPDLIHVQHEFKLFGRKVPKLYIFPKWLAQVRAAVPNAKIVLTAHTVLNPDYKFPRMKRGVQIPIRIIANQVLLPMIRSLWLKKTWGNLDGIIVHSKYQKEVVEKYCSKVSEIAHFVPDVIVSSEISPQKKVGDLPEILVFGYISVEKGQDLAIKAFAKVKTPARLILAGGVRHKSDERYYKHCRNLIESLNLQDKVLLEGFAPEEKINSYYQRATIVLAPFRETWGSGSLVQAFARGKAILTSDLQVNKELSEREPGCLDFFKAGDDADAAFHIDDLLLNAKKREVLEVAALRYAEKFSIPETARRHVDFYKEVIECAPNI